MFSPIQNNREPSKAKTEEEYLFIKNKDDPYEAFQELISDINSGPWAPDALEKASELVRFAENSFLSPSGERGRAYHLLGIIQANSGKLMLGLENLERAIKEISQSNDGFEKIPSIYREIAFVHYELGDPQSAINALNLSFAAYTRLHPGQKNSSENIAFEIQYRNDLGACWFAAKDLERARHNILRSAALWEDGCNKKNIEPRVAINYGRSIMSWLSEFQEQERLLSVSQRIVTIAQEQEIFSLKELVDIFVQHTVVLHSAGRFFEALEVLNLADSLLEHTDPQNFGVKVAFTRRQAQIFSDMGQPEEALKITEKCALEARCNISHTSPEFMKCISDLEKLYSDLGYLSKARHCAKEAMMIAEKLAESDAKHLPLLGTTLGIAGHLATTNDKPNTAHSLFLRGRKIADELYFPGSDVTHVVLIRLREARLALIENRLEYAEELIQYSRNMLGKPEGAPSLIYGQLYLITGCLLEKQGELVLADESFEEAEKIFRAYRSPSPITLLSTTLSHRASVSLTYNNFEKALAYSLEAEQILKRLGHFESASMAEVIHNLLQIPEELLMGYTHESLRERLDAIQCELSVRAIEPFELW